VAASSLWKARVRGSRAASMVCVMVDGVWQDERVMERGGEAPAALRRLSEMLGS
jgi:hypothetical protein